MPILLRFSFFFSCSLPFNHIIDFSKNKKQNKKLRRNESINFHPKGFEELGKSSNSNPSYVRIVEHEKEVLVIEHKDGNTRIIAGLLDQLIEKIVDLSTEGFYFLFLFFSPHFHIKLIL